MFLFDFASSPVNLTKFPSNPCGRWSARQTPTVLGRIGSNSNKGELCNNEKNELEHIGTSMRKNFYPNSHNPFKQAILKLECILMAIISKNQHVISIEFTPGFRSLSKTRNRPGLIQLVKFGLIDR
jgi:hypothetical protein